MNNELLNDEQLSLVTAGEGSHPHGGKGDGTGWLHTNGQLGKGDGLGWLRDVLHSAFGITGV